MNFDDGIGGMMEVDDSLYIIDGLDLLQSLDSSTFVVQFALHPYDEDDENYQKDEVNLVFGDARLAASCFREVLNLIENHLKESK